jgi:hypothetical protein
MDAELPRRVDGGAAMNRTDPGLYGDLLYRDGELVIVRSLSGSVVCPDWTADVAAHGHLMFLNIAMDPATRQIYASGKANVGSKVVIVGPDTFTTVIPGGYGNYPSQLAVVDGRVVCYVVLNLTQYGLFDLAGTLLQTLDIPVPYHGTSQGIRFVADDGAVCWGDQTIAGIFEGLVIREWMQRGGYTGGQGQDGGFALSGNGISTLYPSGTTFFPRIAVHDRELALLYVAGATVCWDTLTLPLEALPPVAAPKIAVESYDPLLKAGTPWLLDFTNAGDGTRFQVTKDAQDRLWIAATNPSGHDQTGSVRQLTVEGSSPTPPDPDPHPEPPPMAPDIAHRFWYSPAIASKDLAQVFDQPPADCAFGLPIQDIIFDGANQGPNTWQALVDADAYRKLKAAGIPLVIEMGSIKGGDCQIVNALHNLEWAVGVVREHGGDVACISMDEPLTADKDSCHQGIAASANLVAQFIQRGRELGVPVGWIEAWPHIEFAIQKAFLLQLKALGALPAHWHLDIDWKTAEDHHQDPATMIRDAWALAKECGVAFGVYCNATVDPIATDAAHHANVVALAQKIHGLVPDVPQIVLAAWAFRLPNQQGLQDVPNNFGVHGLLRTFDEVRAIFESAPVPEPPPQENTMLSTFTDPLKEVIAVKAIKPIPGSSAVTWILPNDNVYSCQPDGSYGERPPGTDGAYERNRTEGNIGTFKPADKYISKAYVLVDGL